MYQAQSILDIRTAACTGDWETVSDILPVSRVRLKAYVTDRRRQEGGGRSLQEVAMELEVLTSQLEYERQVQRLINAMDAGAVLSCDLDCSTIQVSGLNSAIQEASACGYEAPVSGLPSHH